MSRTYHTKEEVLSQAQVILRKSLRDIISPAQITEIEKKIGAYGLRRKGYLGNLIERYVFGLEVNSRNEADFNIPGLELKTTPLKKHTQRKYASKERLVFSMIDYRNIIHEHWDTSTFLKKNRLLLLMFYLYELEKTVLDYEFKFIRLLDLLQDISEQDVLQIKRDWEYIVAKIRRGEAHLLSEGETFYLGACTKAANSDVMRDQPRAQVQAKPRAFSLKQQYLNYLIQKKILNEEFNVAPIAKRGEEEKTVDALIRERFAPFIGKTARQIMADLKIGLSKRSKNFKRLLVNNILIGTSSNKVEELEKANVTLKVITLEHTGTLRESLSFPAFNYKSLVSQVWYDELGERMSDFHAQLEMKRFLFVVFQKIKGSDEIILKKIRFWNFPAGDLSEAEKVFDKTVDRIKQGKYYDMPKISESDVAHVRPHGKDSRDTIETPQGTREIKRCFWLNAKYIQEALER